MAFLLWMYLTGLIGLLAAEVNALLEPTQRKDRRALAGAPRAPNEVPAA